jgi:UDP-N-acetylglucosamine 4,6-dehydratase/5-epimerase
MLNGKVFLTGGTGTLGKAIVSRAKRENWPCEFTIYSRDEVKQQQLKRDHPEVFLSLGDVANYDVLERAMTGHDIVIHAAAFKFIPAGELNVQTMLNSNVLGSTNVAKAAEHTSVKKVVGISTDKVCHPVNAYGCSKMLMERIFQEVAKTHRSEFHMTRYGNVLGSNGSIIVDWQRKLKEQGYINATDPNMSRFWLSINDAIDLILNCMKQPSGTILVPKLGSLSLKRMEDYFLPEGTKVTYDGMRPGEKRHEELMTREESRFAEDCGDFYRLWPVWSNPLGEAFDSYSSDTARELSKNEILKMITP